MPNTQQKALRKVSINEDIGHDNIGFENHHFRKISSISHGTPEERIRKSNIIHESHGPNATLGPNDNSDSRIHKVSVTNSVFSRTADTIVEEDEDADKGWFYNFCLKCHTKDDGKPSWEPKFWPKLCPHPYFLRYRKFSRIVSLVLICVLAYIILYAIVGDIAAPPDGILYQLILLTICSYFGGWLMALTTFPPLVGMLFTGMLLQNVNIVDIDEDFAEIKSEISHLALVIILTRAGLDVDPAALKRLSIPVLKLSLIPFTVETCSVMILSKYFLDLSWSYALLLGSIIAAVSPAVVVPCLLRLREKSYGVAKGIPTLIIAVASIDDAASVAVFGVIKSILFSDASFATNIIFGLLSIAGGILFGVVWGTICNYFPERHDPFMTPLRILLLLAGGAASVLGSELIGYGGAGPLACVTAAFVAIAFWSRQNWEVDENPAATAFEIFWLIIQPILFGVTGARIKFNELDINVVGASVGIIVASVCFKIISTVLAGFGCNLNLKEKVFVSIPWMCKAIVQAALGPIALEYVEPGTVEYTYAEKILTTCILSIVVTAPIGALLTTFLGPHLLTKTKMPPLAEVRKRKKSRLSIRDLSIADDNEFSHTNNGHMHHGLKDSSRNDINV